MLSCCKCSKDCCERTPTEVCQLALLLFAVNTVKLNVTCDHCGSVNTLYTLLLPPRYTFGPFPFRLLHLLFFSSSPPFMKAQSQPIRRDDDTVPPQAGETRAPHFFERQSHKRLLSQTYCSTKGSHFHNWLPWLTFKRRPILLRLEAINNTA